MQTRMVMSKMLWYEAGFDGGDAGAMNLRKRFEGGFEDIFFVPDIGHYMMAATKAMLKVCRAMSMSLLLRADL